MSQEKETTLSSKVEEVVPEEVASNSSVLKEEHLVKTDSVPLSDDETIFFTDYYVPWKKRFQLFFSLKHPRDYYDKKRLFFWTPPGQSKYETRLVFKLDCIILSYVCLSFFIRYLDASNISNAYVSGMKEDLNMHGVDYVWLQRGFSLAYGVFGFPLTMIVTRIKPHILLPIIEFLWAVMVLLIIACNTYKGVLVIRIIEGAFEGACFPILHYILGSWYNKRELTLRTAFFLGSGALGTMFGGYIQSGVYASLNNKGGLPGWKWIFVIDFLITLPVVVLGYFIIPDTPHQAKPTRFLSQEDIDYCIKRVSVSEKVQSNHAATGWGILKKLLSSWQFYVFNVFYSIVHLPRDATSYWGIVLKAQGYNVYQRNNIPTTQNAVEVVACILAGLWVSARNAKWDSILIIQVFMLIGLAILVKWDVPRPAQFVAYIFNGSSGALSTIVCSWANEMTREDTQLRAAVLGSFNLINTGPSTAFALKLFNTDYAPRYTKGTKACLGITIVGIFYILVAISFDRYQRRKRDYIEDQVLGKQESSSDPEELSIHTR